MKVVLLTALNYPVANIGVRAFLKNTLRKKYGIEVVGMVATPLWTHNKKGWKDFLKYIKKSGLKFAMKSILASFLLNAKMRASKYVTPDKKREYFRMQEMADTYGFPLLKSDNVNSEEVQEFIENLEPDYLVSCLLIQIVKKHILRIPNEGAINFHPSLVQEHRGTFASFWTLFHNRKHAGATVHFMSEKVDEGPVILQKRFKVDSFDTIFRLDKKNARIGGNLLVRALVKLQKQKAQKIFFQKLGAIFSYPSRNHTKHFKKRGKRVTGWRDLLFRI